MGDVAIVGFKNSLCVNVWQIRKYPVPMRSEKNDIVLKKSMTKRYKAKRKKCDIPKNNMMYSSEKKIARGDTH